MISQDDEQFTPSLQYTCKHMSNLPLGAFYIKITNFFWPESEGTGSADTAG